MPNDDLEMEEATTAADMLSASLAWNILLSTQNGEDSSLCQYTYLRWVWATMDVT